MTGEMISAAEFDNLPLLEHIINNHTPYGSFLQYDLVKKGWRRPVIRLPEMGHLEILESRRTSMPRIDLPRFEVDRLRDESNLFDRPLDVTSVLGDLIIKGRPLRVTR